MASSAVVDRDLGYDLLVKGFNEMGTPELVVGVRGNSWTDDEGTPMAAIAAYSEYGTRNEDGSVHTPERSYLRSTMAENLDKYMALLGKYVGDEAHTPDGMRKALARLGLVVVSDVQKKIVSIKDPPNAESTKRAKKGADNPLIDTGRLRQSIDFEVRKSGETG